MTAPTARPPRPPILGCVGSGCFSEIDRPRPPIRGCVGSGCVSEIARPKPTFTEPRIWIGIGSKLECDGYAGEIFLDSSRGKVPTLEACKQSCEDATGCKSISYYKTKWCSHFSTPCTNTKWNKKAMSLRWSLISQIPPATTTPTTPAGSYRLII